MLTHLKALVLQHDLRAGDRMLFLGGTGWIVWNLQIGALLTSASIVLYDGNPAWPDQQALWRFIDEYRMSGLRHRRSAPPAHRKEDGSTVAQSVAGRAA